MKYITLFDVKTFQNKNYCSLKKCIYKRYRYIHLEADLSRLGETLPSFVSLGGDGDFDFSLLSDLFFLALLGDRLRFLRGDRLFLRLLDRLLRRRSLWVNNGKIILNFCIRAVPLKNPRVGKTPPLTLDPPAPGFLKILDPPPRPQICKVDRTPPPPDSLLSLRPPTPRFLGLFGLKTVLF